MEVCRKRCDGKMKNCDEREKAEVGKWDGKGEVEEEENGGRWERWRRGKLGGGGGGNHGSVIDLVIGILCVHAYRWEVMCIHLGVDRVV